MVWMADVELHAELREFPFPWSSLLFRGIALLGQALHCLVASAMLCYLVHCYSNQRNNYRLRV